MPYTGHTNEILTPPFQRYEIFSSAAGFILPRINVRSSRVRTRTKQRIHHTDQVGQATNHTDRAGRVKFEYSDEASVLKPYRLAGDVADADREDSDGIEGDLDMDTVEAVSIGLNLGWEKRVKALVTTEASYTKTVLDLNAGTRPAWQQPFSNDASNLRAIIEEGMNLIARHGGCMADSLLISPRLMPHLSGNKIIRETLRYHRVGGLSKALLAEYLSTEGMEFSPDNIMVPRITHNTAGENNPSYDYVWDGTEMILFASAKPQQAAQSVFFGATLTFEGTPAISSRRAVDFQGDIHEGLFWQHEKVYSFDRAVFIKGGIA